ncbi:MAG: Gfo/Idh/MocA family oxidoreductase [Candidatus Omnitrophota bacterium]
MKVIIVGLGSIGRRHLKNLKLIDPQMEIAVLRQHSKDADLGDLKSLASKVFFNTQEAIRWEPNAVFITNPAPFHIKTALSFAKENIHLFIEKPLSVSVKEIDPLLKECRQRKLILMVGYVLRFYKPLMIAKAFIEERKIGCVLSINSVVGRYLPDWRPGSDYKVNVSARSELGGGVIFELSHELDYVRWLVGEITEVSAIVDKISDFDIDVEDIAEINLRFKNGAFGHIHLDMLDRAVNRSCRIIGSDGTLVWDFNSERCLRFYNAKEKIWVDMCLSSPDYNQAFIDELAYFFECILKKEEPLVNGREGQRIVEAVIAVKRSARIKKVIKI